MEDSNSTSEMLTLDEKIAAVERFPLSAGEKEEIINQIRLSEAVSATMEKMADRIRAGEAISWDEVASELDRVAEEHGFEGGLPMPDLNLDTLECGHRLILAERAPMSMSYAAMPSRTELEERLREELSVINSWDVVGDMEVAIVETEEGRRAVRVPGAGARLRRLLNRLQVVAAVPTMTAEAELAALASLKEKINENQYRLYVLTGCFTETSKRSGLIYMFRKGFPTLAISPHGKLAKDCKVIAALCHHPYGYYDGTFVGVMPPTDEVVAALLMMRGDEHGFWKKSGQWHAADLRSGI